MNFVGRWNFEGLDGANNNDGYPLLAATNDYFIIEEPIQNGDMRFYKVVHYREDGGVRQTMVFSQYKESYPVNVFTDNAHATVFMSYIFVEDIDGVDFLNCMAAIIGGNDLIDTAQTTIGSMGLRYADDEIPNYNFTKRWNCSSDN